MKKNYTYKEATPEQIKEWHETEGKWWADRALTFVAIASVLQVLTLLTMGAIMYGLDNIFGI